MIETHEHAGLLHNLIATRDTMLDKTLQAQKEVEKAQKELEAFKEAVFIQVICPKIEIKFPDGKEIKIDSIEKMKALRDWANIRLMRFSNKITEAQYEVMAQPYIETLRGEPVQSEAEKRVAYYDSLIPPPDTPQNLLL